MNRHFRTVEVILEPELVIPEQKWFHFTILKEVLIIPEILKRTLHREHVNRLLLLFCENNTKKQKSLFWTDIFLKINQIESSLRMANRYIFTVFIVFIYKE